MANILRDYPPLPPFPHPARVECLEALHADNPTPEQAAALDREIARAGMTLKKAEKILRTWVRKGYAPFSAMDIAELAVLKREYGSYNVARLRVCGTEGM